MPNKLKSSDDGCQSEEVLLTGSEILKLTELAAMREHDRH